jgi:DNA-binding XRE family transcriptional regulator
MPQGGLVKGELFWTRVKARRGYMRQGDIAKAIGVTSTTMSSWVTKGRIPRGDQALLIARAIGCKVEDLFAEEGVNA